MPNMYSTNRIRNAGSKHTSATAPWNDGARVDVLAVLHLS